MTPFFIPIQHRLAPLTIPPIQFRILASGVSLRTMDQNMKDSSVQNFHLGLERQVLGSFLLRAQYQGSLGRHLPMLENYNRYDGDAYGVASPTSLTAVLPNALYNGFNYRSNSITSSYHALVLEAQKHHGHGLQFETGHGSPNF